MTVCAVLIGLTEIPVMVELSTNSGTATQGNHGINLKKIDLSMWIFP